MCEGMSSIAEDYKLREVDIASVEAYKFDELGFSSAKNCELEEMNLFSSGESSDGIDEITEVVLRQERSLNGIRTEVYYKTINYGDAYIREDLLEPVGEPHPTNLEEYFHCTEFYCESAWEIEYETEVAPIDEHDSMIPLVYKLYEVSGKAQGDKVVLHGAMDVIVKGIWHKVNETVYEMQCFDKNNSINFVWVINSDGTRKIEYKGNAHFMYGESNDCLSGVCSAFEFFKNLEVECLEEIDTDPMW